MVSEPGAYRHNRARRGGQRQGEEEALCAAREEAAVKGSGIYEEVCRLHLREERQRMPRRPHGCRRGNDEGADAPRQAFLRQEEARAHLTLDSPLPSPCHCRHYLHVALIASRIFRA